MYIEDELQKSIQEKEKLMAILEAMIERASGFFQWVSLVLPRVVRLKSDSLEYIRSVIKIIPKDLSDFYKEALTRIDEDDIEESRQMMQFILFSRRPLLLTELNFAMSIQADCGNQSITDLRPRLENFEDMEKLVRCLSGGLAEVIEHKKKRIVQFIHQSVSVYLIRWEGLQILDGSLESEGFAIGHAHLQLLKVCICYLAITDTKNGLDEKRETEIISAFPFLSYATTP
jgi:hypothetical protein